MKRGETEVKSLWNRNTYTTVFQKFLRQDLMMTTIKKKIALAVCLITIWVATATSAETQSSSEEQDSTTKVIVREGHRVVVVEYDENGHHNTKVSISPLEKSSEDVHRGHGRGAGELICDAYGKCKQKIASTFGRASDNDPEGVYDEAKEAVQDGAYKVRDKARDGAYHAKEAVEDQIYNVRDAVHNTKEAVKDRAHHAKEAVKDRAYHGKDIAKEGVEDQIYKVRDLAHNTKEAVKDRAHHAKETVKDGAYRVRDAAGDAVHRAKDRAEEALKEGAHDAKEVVGNAVFRLPSMSLVVTVVSLLGFSTALGTSVWISLVSSYVLARALGRQQFGVVQSKVYPAYFKVMACCIGAALLGHLRRRLSNPTEMYQAYNLSASLLFVLANLFLIEPRATKVMFERMKIQKEDGRGIGELQTQPTTKTVASRTVTSPAITSTAARASIQTPLQETAEDYIVRGRVDEVNRKLKRYNSSSSLLNMLTVMSLLWHLVYLSQLLQDCYP